MAASGSRRRPNILFFFTDDQRFDTIHALGNPHIHTPHMDALVRQGTAFTRNCIMGGSCGAVCMPSRAMLMTGRTLYRIKGMGQTVAPEHVMLPELLRREGYQTFGVGKWHNGPDAYARCFTDGAEIFFGGMDDHWNVPACDFDPTGRYPEPRERTTPMEIRYDDEGRPYRAVWTGKNIYDHVRPGKHSSELFADAAIEFLKRRDASRPFFAYVAFMAPHDPRETRPDYHAMYDPDKLPLPESFMPAHPFDNGQLTVRDEMLAPRPRTPENTRQQIADYYAMITHADAQMGRVMETLEETGAAEETIIVFAGDNGLALGRHGLMGKQNLYDHSVRVPLIFKGPGVPQGQTRDAFTYLVDVYPTLCEMIGLPAPDTVEGRSLAPALRDPSERVRDALHFAYCDLQRAVRDRRFKLIEYAPPNGRFTQLFDLENDPHELNNLAEAPGMAAEVARLRRELRRWPEELGDTGEQGQAFWGRFWG
ncbi:MAG TPA: sulfatase-like hydrolase/transferase [Candidatus Brocadiia bacterium]|nr:sulfatase-like hydrolase/transferase [Candidatus Brocadiia bacterium]